MIILGVLKYVRHLLGPNLVKYFGYKSLWLTNIVLGRKPIQGGFGLEGLDSKLLQIIDTSPNFYVELGANDGVSQSNTLSLELAFGWRGLLIEPAWSSYRKLRRNRSLRRNFLLRAACVGDSYELGEIDLVYSNLMSVAVGIESDVPNINVHAQSGAQFLEPGDEVRVETVPALTLTTALNIAKAPTRMGLLSLDVEGAELEVLKGLNLRQYSFDWILVESRSVAKISDHLARFGYQLEQALSLQDYLFRRYFSSEGDNTSYLEGS